MNFTNVFKLDGPLWDKNILIYTCVGYLITELLFSHISAAVNSHLIRFTTCYDTIHFALDAETEGYDHLRSSFC